LIWASPILQLMLYDYTLNVMDIKSFIFGACVFFVLSILKVISFLLIDVLSKKIQHHFYHKKRIRFFEKIYLMKLEFIQKFERGKLAAIFCNETDNVALHTVAWIQLLLYGLLIMFLCFIGWTIFQPVGYVYISLCAVLLIWPNLWRRSIGLASYKIGDSYSKLYAFYYEVVPGLRDLKVYQTLNVPLQILNNISEYMKKSFVKNSFYNTMSWQIAIPFQWIANLLMLYVGAKGIVKSEITLGYTMALMDFVFASNFPIIKIINLMNTIHNSKSDRIRLKNINGENEHQGKKYSQNKLDIQIQNGSFGYLNADVNTLCGINLSIEYGRKIALIGTSGSGKSTLGRTIAGLLYFNSGNYFLGGCNVLDWNLSELRQRISYMSQECTIFPDTIRKNVDIDCRVSDDEILNLFKELNLINRFAELELGLDTIYKPNTVYFSGGEIQRICLARLLLRNSEILIFDEPVAAIDAINENKIMNTIFEHSIGKTLICITHSDSFLNKFDVVYRVQNGILSEERKCNNNLNKVYSSV
jgi:ABC-type multidrug transport system fused ATPase/permease subunit